MLERERIWEDSFKDDSMPSQMRCRGVPGWQPTKKEAVVLPKDSLFRPRCCVSNDRCQRIQC